jgi:hypothetical protein
MIKETSYCDGDNVEIMSPKKTNETTITLEFAGSKLTGEITRRRPSPTTPMFYGYFLSGHKVMPFDQSVYTAIEACQNAAIAEAETDESWIARMAAEQNADNEAKAYDKHVAMMAKAMSM